MKTLIILLITCAVLHNLHAQKIPLANEKQIGVGLFGGLTYTALSTDAKFPVRYKAGGNMVAGLDVRYRLNSRVSLHVQPSWSQSSRDALAEAWSNTYVSYKFTTIKLPLICRYYPPNQKLFFVQAGAAYNQLLNSTYSERVNLVCIAAPCPAFYSTGSATTKASVSALAGFGFNIDLQKVSIPIVMQYERAVNRYTIPLGDGYSDNFRTLSLGTQTVTLTTGVNF